MEGGVVAALKALERKDPMENLMNAIDSLYTLRDTFFPLDPTVKKARLDNRMQEVLAVLNEIAAGISSLSSLLALCTQLL